MESNHSLRRRAWSRVWKSTNPDKSTVPGLVGIGVVSVTSTGASRLFLRDSSVRFDSEVVLVIGFMGFSADSVGDRKAMEGHNQEMTVPMTFSDQLKLLGAGGASSVELSGLDRIIRSNVASLIVVSSGRES